MEFVDRKEELAELEKYKTLSEKKLFTVLIYGQRRVGKTELIRQFVRNKKHLYFFVYDNKSERMLLKEFEEELKREKIIEDSFEVRSWDGFVKVLFEKCEGYVVIFDEFQSFRSVYPAFFSIMQRAIDENRNKRMIFAFLGSITGLIKKTFEDLKAPLYGRLQAKLEVSPFSYKNTRELMRELEYHKERDYVELYSLFGGVPKYYVMVEDYSLQGKKLPEILDAFVLGKNAPLRDEVMTILRQEFGSGKSNYYAILEAIATGSSKLIEISNYVGLKQTDLSPFMKDLMGYFRYVKREVPATEEYFRSRAGVYRISNNFFNFWFRFIHRNYSYYEMENFGYIREKIQSEFGSYVGKAFEEIALEFVREASRKGLLPSNFDKIGRWWHKNEEIDIVGLNRKEKKILFVEVKWSSLSKKDAETLLLGLREKSRGVKWLGGEREESFGIVAESIGGKQELRNKGYFVFDLEDFKDVFEF